MVEATDEREAAAPVHDELWFRHHVLTRFFATVWWGFMVLVTGSVAATAVDLVRFRTPGNVASLAIMLIVFIPVYREWPNWRRMGRMLRHGT